MKDTYGSYLVRDVLAIVGGHTDIRALHSAAGAGASAADGKPAVRWRPNAFAKSAASNRVPWWLFS